MRKCIAKGGFVAVEHEKIFATKCRCRDSHKGGRKPNVNVKKKKKTAVVDFVELTLLLGEDEAHLKFIFVPVKS